MQILDRGCRRKWDTIVNKFRNWQPDIGKNVSVVIHGEGDDPTHIYTFGPAHDHGWAKRSFVSNPFCSPSSPSNRST